MKDKKEVTIIEMNSKNRKIKVEWDKILYERELEDRCMEQINECYEPVRLLSFEFTYEQGHLLKDADPIVWRQVVEEYISNEHGDGRLKEAKDPQGHQCWIQWDEEENDA